MKNIKLYSLILCLTMIFIGCGSSDDNSPLPQIVRTYDDIRADFDAFNFTTGNNDVSLLSLENENWNFRVIMPDVDFTNNNRPLIIALHGFSNGDNTNSHLATSCYIEPGYAALDAIIISPNYKGRQWEDLFNQRQILSLVDLAVTFLPVNPNRIVVTGYSAGANGSWFSGETQPNVFSAAIPVASSYNTNSNGSPRFIETPMYVIHGENDELFPLSLTEGWVNDAIGAGADITFVVAPGLTHTEPCSYVPYIQDAADWLVNSVWN